MKRLFKCSIEDLKEYSKKVIQQMVNVWFIGAIFGMLVVTAEVIISMVMISRTMIPGTVHLQELFTYIGAPVGGGILGYLLKSAFENREKIRKDTTNGGIDE